MQYAPYPFFALGITFIAIGATGQHTLIYVGVVFFALALVMMVKMRKP